MDYRNVIKSVENSPENCIFPGFVEDIFEVYSGADVYFMPSYAEGHSIVMLEALSMGLPMIARDLEEFREAFSDNLIYFTDIKDINKSMFSKTYLEEYKKKTEIVKTYSIDKIAKEHIKLYESLLNS
jgi:glycosyltransferase involved in cell wall biosynthesis